MAYRQLVFFVVVGLLGAIPACDDEPPFALPDPCDRIGDPDFTGPGYGVIGPDGGVIEQSDPANRLFGVKVEVPPGAWEDCWEVSIQYETIFGTPDYPDGYVPFERPDPSGAVDIDIGLSTLSGFYRSPDPLPIQLSFPMAGIQPEPIEVRTGYLFDEAQETWRIVFPDALSPDRLGISSATHEPLFSWGLINLNDVDFDAHVAPAMEENLGTETWTEFQEAVDELYRQGLEEQNLRMCIGLDLAEDILIGLQQSATESVLELQMLIDCGECNPITTEFYEGIRDYILLNIEAMIAEMVIDVIPGGLITFPLKLAAYGWLLSVEAAIEALPCDYPCFVRRAPPIIYVHVAIYYGAEGMLDLINWYRNSEYIMCPPAPASEQLLMPPG